MKINQYGLTLVRTYEGFRARAYQDSVGVWTIGYGHTSMAGLPVVKSGLNMPQAEALRLLETDLANFSRKVASLIVPDLNDNQFSAVVSLAYNIGVGNFKCSGVLRAINKRQFLDVPRRIQMFVKAGGRILAGLVKRRSAEAHLWLTPTGTFLMEQHFAFLTPEEDQEIVETRGMIDMPAGTAFGNSKIAVGALMTGALGAVQGAVSTVQGYLSGIDIEPKMLLGITLTVAIGALAFFIIKWRMDHARDDNI